MEHYRTFLRAQISKLRHLEYAQRLQVLLPADALQRLRLDAAPKALVQRFSRQSGVDAFVADLAPGRLVELTDLYDRCWLKNGVSRRLSTRQHAEFRAEAVERIRLRYAEPENASIFRRHDFRLCGIAADRELRARLPYRLYTEGAAVEVPCLAVLDHGEPRIIDGMHRAVQLAFNGEREVPLCLALEP